MTTTRASQRSHSGCSDRRAVLQPHNPSAIRTLGRTHEGKGPLAETGAGEMGFAGTRVPLRHSRSAAAGRGEWGRGRENICGCPSGTPSPPQRGVKLVDTGCVSSQAQSTFRPGPPLLREAELWLSESVSERVGDRQGGKPEEEEEEGSQARAGRLRWCCNHLADRA